MNKTRIVNINSIFIIIVVFIFILIILKIFYIGLGFINVNNISLSTFASNRNTKKEIINARRGTIYSKEGEVLAKDVNSYTVIAYLDSSRTTNIDNPHHVIDKEMTAEVLSPLINMTKEKILELLNMKIEVCDDGVCEYKTPYQVELGPGGRGITELLKDEIDDLGLPGIDFLSSIKRYYPNGDFLSYTIGYARTNDNGNYIGEMGIELSYNGELTGKNGYKEYQADLDGYQITSSPTIEEKSVSGNDIYLTIDTNIQMFTKQAMTIIEKGNPKWASIVVVDAKTGEILGLTSSPSFNNNKLDIVSYYDPFVSYEFEPGSTMKIFSYMAAMENGVYEGKDTLKSGSLKVDDTVIYDWNRKGWGTITYDEGFMGSSNVAASNLGLTLGRAKLKDYYISLGFNNETNIGLPNEMSGVLDFKYNTEIASASYGQGISVTQAQMIQALTSIANDGTVIKPHIIKKIVDSQTGDIILENKREELGKVASEETIGKITELMRGVVDGTASMSTGKAYYQKGYDLIGKTGTAEIATSSGYLSGNYVRSFAGLFPGDDPQIIVYTVASNISASSYMQTAVKTIVKDIYTYLNIDNNASSDLNTYTLDSYINNDTGIVSELLSNSGLEPIIIGNGNKIINQYPNEGSILNINNKVFLLTNNDFYTMPDINNWSRTEVKTYFDLINIDVSFEGYGYVYEYSIPKKTIINKEDKLNVKLKQKYNIE